MLAEVIAYLSVGRCLEGNLANHQPGVATLQGTAQRRLEEDLQKVGPAQHNDVGAFVGNDVGQGRESAFAVIHLLFLCIEVAVSTLFHHLDAFADGGVSFPGADDGDVGSFGLEFL